MDAALVARDLAALRTTAEELAQETGRKVLYFAQVLETLLAMNAPTGTEGRVGHADDVIGGGVELGGGHADRDGLAQLSGYPT